MAVVVVGEDPQLHAIGVVERLGLEPFLALAGCLRRNDFHALAAVIVPNKDVLEILRFRLAGQEIEVKRHADKHALPEISD